MAESSSPTPQGKPTPRRISTFDRFVKFVTDACELGWLFLAFPSAPYPSLLLTFHLHLR